MDLTSLQAFWELGEASGTRNDSHSTNHLTDNNTVLSATGKVGNAADFERDNAEYLSIADNAALSMGDIDFSITCWVWFESLTDNDQCLISKGDLNSYDTAEFSLEYGGAGLVRLFVGNGTTTRYVYISGATVTTSTWYFLYAYHDSVNDQIGISIDNGTVNFDTWAAGSYNSTLDLNVGKWANYAGGYHDGLIDQVGVWKRLLTPAEVTYLYNSGSGRSYADMVPAAADNVYWVQPGVVLQGIKRGAFF